MEIVIKIPQSADSKDLIKDLIALASPQVVQHAVDKAILSTLAAWTTQELADSVKDELVKQAATHISGTTKSLMKDTIETIKEHIATRRKEAMDSVEKKVCDLEQELSESIETTKTNVLGQANAVLEACLQRNVDLINETGKRYKAKLLEVTSIPVLSEQRDAALRWAAEQNYTALFHAFADLVTTSSNASSMSFPPEPFEEWEQRIKAGKKRNWKPNI